MAAAGEKAPGRLARYRAALFTGPSVERTVFFSDAVFAIAMTLLVLEINVPEVQPGDLLQALADDWYQFFAYALGFACIALTWFNHHNIWKLIRGYTAGLQWINLLVLFFITLLPVATSILAMYGPSTATAPILFALTISGFGFALLWLLAYARRHGLLVDSVEPDFYVMVRRQLTLMPTVFLISCGIALFQPFVAMMSWSSLSAVFAVSNAQMRRKLRAHDQRDALVPAPPSSAALHMRSGQG